MVSNDVNDNGYIHTLAVLFIFETIVLDILLTNWKSDVYITWS